MGMAMVGIFDKYDAAFYRITSISNCDNEVSVTPIKGRNFYSGRAVWHSGHAKLYYVSFS